jgi:hypothetical protein
VPGGLVGQGPHRRPHRLGEAGDRRRVQAVGLGQPTRGAGEGPHLARVDHRDRQAGRGQGRREADLHAAGGLEHHQRRRERDQAPTSAATLSSSWPKVELSPEGREWMSRRCLETSMPTKVGAWSMTRFRWMRACRPW